MYTSSMPAHYMFLVRHAASGLMSTIVATSERAAVMQAVAKHKPSMNDELLVKLRGDGPGWTKYRVTSAGIRKLPGVH